MSRHPNPVATRPPATPPRVAVVGNPNVGKSVLFTALTGRYAAASNYPGTTVEVLRGPLTGAALPLEVVDTPGMYSLLPLSEEERVARRILMDEAPRVVVHVVDARNLDRMLPMTLQLLEAGLPLLLAVNMLDEAENAGLQVDLAGLAARLGVPVVGTVAVSGRGLPELRAAIAALASGQQPPPPVADAAADTLVRYPPRIREALARLVPQLPPGHGLSPRAIALLLLQDDGELCARVQAAPGGPPDLPARLRELTRAHTMPIEYELAVARKDAVNDILADTVRTPPARLTTAERLSRLTMNPLTGLPILALVLYWGFYRFVGGIGAGTLVDLLEEHLFGRWLTPWLTTVCERLLPWPILQDLFVGDYGLLTLGLRYAVAIVLPIVGMFFLVFAVVEDSGYLPRLAMLLDRAFKKMGLSGRAVIPMVLGFGCLTMATLVTRTLPTRRERVLATLLLALGIPCSAQFGVILALLHSHRGAMLVWAAFITLLMLVVGYLGARLLPGPGPSFYMELPPLRWPQPLNVLTKTYVRVKWYLYEVLPLFLLASLLIWLGKLTGLFDLCVRLLRPPVRLMGLPAETAEIFLFGFFRRDYGAAGLYDLNKAGALTGTQLTVACVALTLFLPCIAQLLVNIRERGWKTGLGISAFVLAVAFGASALLNHVLLGLGVPL